MRIGKIGEISINCKMTHLDIGYEFYLPDELLLHVVLDQVVVDPPLSVGQTVPGDVEWALCRLQSTGKTKPDCYIL